MKLHKISLFVLIILSLVSLLSAKDNTVTIDVQIKRERQLDSINLQMQEHSLYNMVALESFLEKLKALEGNQTQKINIVHIGDSHIQADFMTDMLRQRFQSRFGNAGLGLVFPHSIIRTNTGRHVRFSSNINWNSHKNTTNTNTDDIGISGYSLSTQNNDFLLELNLKNKQYQFNTLKIITPNNQRFFDLAISNKQPQIVQQEQTKTINHLIKKGETLSVIANKYKVSVASIQKDNKLSGTNIKAGSTLKIVTKTTTEYKVDYSNFQKLEKTSNSYHYYTYENLDLPEKIYLIPNEKNTNFALNGVVLENQNFGIIYHTIGVNGAKFSDYNKCKMFFEQIIALEPDLIIVSLGTNEAFDKITAENFYDQAQLFMTLTRLYNKSCPMLLTSPPPSYFNKKTPHNYCADFANTLIDNSKADNYSTFDLYRAMGGNESMQRLINQNLIAKDRVHYTVEGYQQQGTILFDALMKAYSEYRNLK
ncbi:MAG: LysM peptidoglycan-binding domain-containing protein [Bacteroidota bacterium]|nr:LysM peptidoglycan-binding domain-containing protein [Bacteroidota bacterium]